MKCDEPFEGNEFAGCLKDLGHDGDHERYQNRWPRPEPVEPNEAVAELLEATLPRGAWGMEDREFFLAFEVTNVYLVPVSAESEDDALKQYSDYCDFPDFSRYDAHDGSVEVRRPTAYEHTGMTGAPIGPQIACPDCGALAMRRSWYHRPLRKCHGPIEWSMWTGSTGKLWASRKHEAHAGWAGA